MRIIHSDGRDEEVSRIELMVSGHIFTITEDFGEMKIHSVNSDLILKPHGKNEIIVSAQE